MGGIQEIPRISLSGLSGMVHYEVYHGLQKQLPGSSIRTGQGKLWATPCRSLLHFGWCEKRVCIKFEFLEDFQL